MALSLNAAVGPLLRNGLSPSRSDGPTVGRQWFVAALALWLVTAGGLPAAEIDEGFEGLEPAWALAESDAAPKLAAHERIAAAPHRGERCERLRFSASTGTVLRLQMPIGRLAVIDELACSLWVRGSRPDIRLSVRVVLPGSTSRKTGRPVETLVPGTLSTDIDRWELLEVTSLPQRLAGQLPALRMEHGAGVEATGAVATHVVLDVYTGPGGYDVSIDDLLVEGAVPAAAPARHPASNPVPHAAAPARHPASNPVPHAAAPARHPASNPVVYSDPLVQPVAAQEVGPPKGIDGVSSGASIDPPAGVTRGVIEVDGLPFFPRALDHNGEPLDSIAALGFNCVRLATPAGSDLLAEARRAGLWVICPPPEIPDVDVRDLESMPVLRNWDRVLMWDMGSGLAAGDLESLAEKARRVRACDVREGRPLIAAPDSSVRSLSRHVDLLVARRTVLGTSLELIDYLRWLRERPRLARPGTPLLAELATEIDPRAARQAAAIAGVGGQGLAVDPESLSLAALSAVAAGARGIFFTSNARIDGDDAEARKRAAAVREMNLRLKVLEPFGAAGRFAAQAHSSDPEVQAVVMEAARARVVVAWRCVQGSQIVARRYGGADMPRDDVPLTLLVPGVPEAHQAWEIAAGGLKPLRQKRVTGGVAVTLDHFLTHALVLVSGEPAVTAHVQERLRELAPVELVSARSLAAVALADAASLLGKLPPQAFSGPPPVAAGPMLSTANQLASEGESYVGRDAGEAIARLRKAAAIAGQFERRIWENGVHADGSMVASPLVSSDAALAEHWRFVEARATVLPGAELLRGGGMDAIEDLAGNGWRHFAQPLSEIVTAVEISKASPAAGSGSLRLVARPKDSDAAPVVVETPPVWVTTPPIAAPPGKLVEISAMVRVEKPIIGSVDGLMVFDSLGGPALAERVGPTKTWRRLVLYRIVPADAADEPLTVTFALTGLGAAEIDEVSIKPLERGAAGVVAVPPAGAPAEGGAFPSPQQLLVSAPVPPVVKPAAAPQASAAVPPPPAAAAAAPRWPGMTLDWPQLPFGQSSNAPPPGPGGGTIDPFKRARAAQPSP
jgi:hypothetical protein